MKGDKEQNLPRDIDALIALIIERDKSLAERNEQITQLRHNLEVYARMLFGQSSEKRKLTGLASGNPHQLHLFVADLVADAERIAEATGAVGFVEVEFPKLDEKPKRRKGSRKGVPENTPVVETVFELAESDRECACGGQLHQIGFEETSELERIEVTIQHRKKRAKYACRSCEEGVVTAPGPARVIDKGLLGPGFLAHIIGERFQFHMPYYRLEKKYAGEGLALSRSVLERSVARCAELLAPLHEALKLEVSSKDIVFTDDTTVRLVNSSRPDPPKKGRIWIYLDKLGNHYYDFTESRERDGPLEFFRGYSGYVQADAYTGYDQVFLSEDIFEVACWAHTRRKFEKAKKSDPKLSAEALELIAKLYLVESHARKAQFDAERIMAFRQEHSRPVLAEIRDWLGVIKTQVLPKSPMGQAVYYAQAQWDALNAYLTDGRLEIDNNAAERAMRPIAVGRKNWLFFQSVGGGKTAAVLMSLIQTAEAAGVNVKLYLRDVLQRIATESDVKMLLPFAWKQHFEQDVFGRRNEIIELLVADQQVK